MKDLKDNSINIYQQLFNEENKVKNGKYPLFVETILDNDYLNDQSKADFIEKFLNKYMKPNNDEYRRSVRRKYLLFINKMYYGIITNKEEIYKVGIQGDDRYYIQILGIPLNI
jgi:hypothetical protein